MEGDAGASRLNPADEEGSSDADPPGSSGVANEASADEVVNQGEEATEAEPVTDPAVETGPAPGTAVASSGRPSRLGRGWMIGIAATLLVLGAGVATGGYFASRYHNQSQALARADVAAIQAAKDCVSATQAPNTAAMAAAQQKIVECTTGSLGAQAALYTDVLIEAYQAGNVQLQVSDMRAAVEKHNEDGSIDVLVAVRVKLSNTEAHDQEEGYRLRVQMTLVDGTFKVAKLDQVAT
jgi:Mce-associated membrane protein